MNDGLKKLSTVQNETDQKLLMRKSGEIIAEILDDDLETTDTETTVELKFCTTQVQAHFLPRGVSSGEGL